MSTQATPEEIAFVVADAQTWPDAYVARRVVLHLAGEVAALRRQLEERGDVVPELTAKDAEAIAKQCEKERTPHYAMAFLMHKWIASRVTTRAPSADVVTVPREEWAVAQILANAWIRHPLTCEERDKLVSEWDALRSGEAVATPPQDTVTMSREEWDTKCAELASAIRMLWMVEDRFSSASYSEHRQIQGEVEWWLESHDPEQIHFATLRTSAQAPAQRGEG